MECKNKTLVKLLFDAGICLLPMEYIDEVEVLFKDGDSNNVEVSNLTYRYKNGPIEHKDVKGFYYIPFFERYVISEEGYVYSLIRRRLKSWYRQKESEQNVRKNVVGGYFFGRMINNAGKSQIVGRHRALALAFKRYDFNIDDLDVNHENGIPGDDVLSNLSWVTRRENILHAYNNGLRNDNTPISVMDYDTGLVRRYVSASSAAIGEGLRGYDNVFRRVNMTRNGVLSPERRLYITGSSNDFPKLVDPVVHTNGLPKRVIARDVLTGKTFLFDSASQAAVSINTNPANVIQQCSSESFKAINGFNVRYYDGAVVWPQHSEYQLLAYKHNPAVTKSPYLIVDGSNVLFCKDVREVMAILKKSKCTVLKYCLEGKPFENGMLVKRIPLNKLIESPV